jgi:hypothetical protein
MNLTIPRAAPVFFAFLLLAVCATARGEEAEGVYFQHGDWEIVCDNTLTCRMAGYCAEEDHENGCGSVLITRAAGPNAPLEGKVTMADFHDERPYPREYPSALTLQINDQSKGKLKHLGDNVYPLTPTQIRALLVAARKDDVVEFASDTQSFTLSGKGISAVLLKADEVQGRIGTPGALIRKGNKPEESVFPPRPAPVIRAAKVSDKPSRELTAPEVSILEAGKESLCEFEGMPEEDIDRFTLTPLDDSHVLISTLCWHAMYNDGDAYWVVDHALKGNPELVTRDGGWYKEGMIYKSVRGRGMADCMYGSGWVWDGQAFRLFMEWSSGDCRSIHLGGTWHLPTFVADVLNEDGTPRRSELDSK